jgi:GntR family carbon starvation induced transcriptional regulator
MRSVARSGDGRRVSAAVDGPVSRIEWVEDQLRRAILSGELRPGERLLTAPLSERFQVSPTPLREALHRFAGEGLVEFVPQRGARVTDLSADDCAELSELRALLEPRCVAHAIEQGDDPWRQKVVAMSAELQDRWRADPHDARESEGTYRTFYEVITSTCDSERLRRYSTVIRDQESRYRLVTIADLDRGALAVAHRRLVDATLDGDAASASDAIRDEVAMFAGAYAARSRES